MLWLIIGQFFDIDRGSLYFNAFAGGDSLRISLWMIHAKTRFFVLYISLQNVWVYRQPLLHNRTQKLPNLANLRELHGHCSWSFKVTNFGTNQKRTCDFLLVINSNLPPILHRFQVVDYYKSNFRWRQGSASLQRPRWGWSLLIPG